MSVLLVQGNPLSSGFMLGFEKPESGTIYYDDQDLAELDVTRVRQNMGVVIQGGNVMAGDIFNNIIGNHPLTLDDAWEAASMAGFDEDIKQMPTGFQLSERQIVSM